MASLFRFIRSGLVGTLLIVGASNFSEGAEMHVEESTGREPLRMSAQTGMGFFGGTTGWNVNFGVGRRLSPSSPITWCVEGGATFWNMTASSLRFNPVLTTFQFLPSLTYTFSSLKLGDWHPYAGVAIGTAFISGPVEVNGWPIKQQGFVGHAMIRLGVESVLFENVSFAIEPKLGWLAESFLFMPVIRLSFVL